VAFDLHIPGNNFDQPKVERRSKVLA